MDLTQHDNGRSCTCEHHDDVPVNAPNPFSHIQEQTIEWQWMVDGVKVNNNESSHVILSGWLIGSCSGKYINREAVSVTLSIDDLPVPITITNEESQQSSLLSSLLERETADHVRDQLMEKIIHRIICAQEYDEASLL